MSSSDHDIEKHHLGQHETLQDKELFADREAVKARAMQHGHLSEQELLDEKRLKRKIDSVIMPMVVLVSCPAPRQPHQTSR